MSNIDTHRKQRLLLGQKYKLYLSKGPVPKSKSSNKYNLLDDLNIKDEVMMNQAKNYIRRYSSSAS